MLPECNPWLKTRARVQRFQKEYRRISGRKFFTPEQKVGILREYLIQKVPFSQLCDTHGVSVVNLYRILSDGGFAHFFKQRYDRTHILHDDILDGKMRQA